MTIVGGSAPVGSPRLVPVAEAPDAATAFAVARRQGSPVAVIDQRMPTREVFANPRGTLTAHLTPVPVRVRRGAGADLVTYADRDGFRQHLVIKNAEAARDPALASIRLALRAEGLRVSVDDSGAVLAVDEAGAEVFGAPLPGLDRR